jgi:hypothetical protein
MLIWQARGVVVAVMWMSLRCVQVSMSETDWPLNGPRIRTEHSKVNPGASQCIWQMATRPQLTAARLSFLERTPDAAVSRSVRIDAG